MTKQRITGYLSHSFSALLYVFVFGLTPANAFTESSVPGGVTIVDLGAASEVRPQARFGSKKIMVIQQDGQWKGLVGLSLKTLPGDYIVSYKSGNKRKTDSEITIKVLPKTYPEQRLKMKLKKYVSPNKEQLARIKKEKIHMGKLFKIWRDTDVSIDLSWPVNGLVSSPFGLKRFFNDQPRNPHSGLDIAAPEGTDIVLPSDGNIIDTGNYYFNGNTVFVDHGQGMISMFNHMSKITAKTGDKLKRGDKIGEVGKTGRVTGPHLHWSLNLNQTRVDPMLFLSEKE
ncbi:MAG: peptidoglycan DD-metalloendopeptidase family protein [Pseudomonadota bacterium]|nr:peptidoglycan DD-metalloendopeptidase family protein [Pseudomonadota bacterium]